MFQIVEVYQHLCHNDGLDPPEPLYITLDTKNNFLAEFSNLIAAAHDGRGLSSLFEDFETDDDGKIHSAENEIHGENQASETESVGHDAQGGNVAAQPEGEEPGYEPLDETRGDHQEQHDEARFEEREHEYQQEPQQEPLDEIPETHTGQGDYSQDYISETEIPADSEHHEPLESHPADLEPVADYDEQVSNASEDGFEAEEFARSNIVGKDTGQISGVEKSSHQEPQHIDSKASEDGELEAGTGTADETQTNHEVEQPTEVSENAAVSDAISSHSLSSTTAVNIDYDEKISQQGEEIEDEQDDDIDLGYGDDSTGLDANITVADRSNEQEGMLDVDFEMCFSPWHCSRSNNGLFAERRDKLENPASPKEDLFEFEDQDYESPGTLRQPSTAQSVVDQEFNQETSAVSTHPEVFSVEENQGEEPVAEPSEDQEKYSPVHSDGEQDEVGGFNEDDDGQYDESVNPNEKDDSHLAEVPSLESGECSPSPQRDSTNLATQQDDIAFATNEAADSAVSSYHKDIESVDISGLQADDQVKAKTPDPLDGLYEIDEDLFKSPIKDLDNDNQPAEDAASMPTTGVSYSKHDSYDSDEIDFDDDDEADVNTKELDTFGVPGDEGDQISNNGSQSAKRSREEEDEVNTSENTPDVKRRRSQ